MKKPRIANAIGHIDDDLVAGAAECKKNRNHWLNGVPLQPALQYF